MTSPLEEVSKATGIDPLASARETNRRLNRRMQELEGPLTSLVSHAQRQAHEAMLRAEAAQNAHTSILRRWVKSHDRVAAQDKIIACLIISTGAFALWAIAATVADISFLMRQ